jgi:hypothetical protein
MNGHWLLRRLAISLVITGGLWLLTGCQSLTAGSNASATVAPGTLTPKPSSLAFGSVQVGSSSSLSEALTNTGGSSVTISQLSSSAATFSISGLNLPVTLTANQSVTFTATLAPTSAGAASFYKNTRFRG